ncbi:hypothetical protein LAUMK4_05745 [Mycobacterium persicum]|uniref:DUF2637 domain-containing protein n=1 Tax=Mycobacterium persicum TaxID=1487726 RepID=A0ABY6RS88_9MYCO|nr:DUF2637 domain-containing protein [Mycobacterium persicum]VBA32404.1 hypothetical protein LAUMK4_05745 [Mycobacterium persicum]
MTDNIAGGETDSDRRTRRRAVGFFWVVLISASAASIAGNALHALVQADRVAPALAAAVATAPPLVNRNPTRTYWAALVMTLLLGVGAFRLSFDALCGLAIRSGIRPGLAWLWPLVVDVTIAQATVSLLALTRSQSRAVRAAATADIDVVATQASPAGPQAAAITAPGMPLRPVAAGCDARAAGLSPTRIALSGPSLHPSAPSNPERLSPRCCSATPMARSPARYQMR